MYCPRKFPKFSETVKFSCKILKNVKNIASNVKFANFLYFCSTQEKVLPHAFPHSGNAFPCAIQKYTKFASFTGLYFPHFKVFYIQT